MSHWIFYRLSYGPAKDKSTLFNIETSANSVTLKNLTSNTQYIMYLTTLKVRKQHIQKEIDQPSYWDYRFSIKAIHSIIWIDFIGASKLYGTRESPLWNNRCLDGSDYSSHSRATKNNSKYYSRRRWFPGSLLHHWL